ncbi:hypothetical protein AFLA_000175 [Aspergillus flavus NRRL3357]|nr:hypothetical protein AFLA_000175 [Aspergillus flavus NRRL3357]
MLTRRVLIMKYRVRIVFQGLFGHVRDGSWPRTNGNWKRSDFVPGSSFCTVTDAIFSGFCSSRFLRESGRVLTAWLPLSSRSDYRGPE